MNADNPHPYEVCTRLSAFLDTPVESHDARRFGVMALCAEAMDALAAYMAEAEANPGRGGWRRREAEIVGDVVRGRVGAAQAAVGLQ